MYVEQTSNNTIAIKELSIQEAHVLLFLINKGSDKIKNNEHFISENRIASEMYKKIDCEILIACSNGVTLRK